MDLNQVTVPCLDLAASVDFHRRLGLHLIVHDSPRYARPNRRFPPWRLPE